MRLAHISDVHLDERRPTFEKGIGLFAQVLAEASGSCDLIVVSGDVAGREGSHRQTARERIAIADALMRAADSVPVVVVSGNHDRDGELEIFSRLRTKCPVLVADYKPELFDVVTASGEHVSVIAVPYQTKRSLGAVGSSDEEAGVWMLRLLAALAESAKGRSDYTVLAMHQLVRGAKASGFELLGEGEVAIGREALDRLGCDYVALGHVHQQQQMAERAYYAGSLFPCSIDEPPERGYLTVTLQGGLLPVVEPVNVESWHLRRVEVQQRALRSLVPGDCRRQHVTVVVKLDRGAMLTQKERAALEAKFRLAGAESVVVLQKESGAPVERCPEIVQAADDTEALKLVLEREGIVGEDAKRLTEKFAIVREAD